MDSNLLPYIKEIILLLEKGRLAQKEILALQEACEYLQISPSFMYKLTSYRKIPFYVPNGKLIYFKRSELDNWTTHHRFKASIEPQNDIEDLVNKP
jgi:excisionase family DNA binding protein